LSGGRTKRVQIQAERRKCHSRSLWAWLIGGAVPKRLSINSFDCLLKDL